MSHTNFDLAIEFPAIRSSFEQLNKVFRTVQKQIEKEITHAVSAISDLNSKPCTPEHALSTLENLSKRLHSLRKSLQDARAEEEMFLRRSRARAELLISIEKNPDITSSSSFQSLRMDRLAVDFLLREGLFASASAIASSSNISDFCDIEIFQSANHVVNGLRSHSLNEAYKWCTEHKSRLQKLESPLEFQLKLQEFIELVRSRKLPQAIDFSRKSLAPLASSSPSNSKQFQQAMALLALLDRSPLSPYQRLLDSQRWEELVDLFRQTNYQLHCLTPQPLLTLCLQAGLVALKTPYCYQEHSRSVNCPCCDSNLGQFAAPLPSVRHVSSSLVCHITGLPIDENNPPLALPNGYVYSAAALSDMAAKNNGVVKCPRTEQSFELDQARKVFIS
eukprot:GILI01000899.1.p1 GENE.GILI01000899.1~~GILI01000899.1.p1  ORF type:complete len:391 (+),score=51.22 GILI01000899.1:113-1285(+)